MDVLTELGTMGTGLGALRWVQGPGGNVSVKAEGTLLVKASGVRLRDVGGAKGHTRVPLADAVAALGGDADADARVFACAPRPSLETYFHALPARAIAHTHALGVLLYACAAYRGARPAGVTGQVPYARPGRGLAVAVRDVYAKDAEEQAIVLLSHGVIVAAKTAERAVALTCEIDDGIRARFGALPPFEPLALSYLEAPAIAVEGGVVRQLPARKTNATATTPPRYLFPDAVICASTILVDAMTDVPALAARSIAETKGRSHVLTDDEGRRAIVGKSASQLDQSTEVLAAHDWLSDVLDAHGGATYLHDDEPARLLSLPSEQYRIRLAAEER
jgi:ribulose-5-phosphate 4-epimerase/fuculose-1-phosphate aldolase